MRLFIDTNIFLQFYSFTKDDLEQLRKLLKLIKNKDVILFLTDQVLFEFDRNRERKIKDSLDKLRQTKFDIALPRFARETDEYLSFRDQAKALDIERNSLIKNLEERSLNETLNADEIIKELFNSCKVQETDAEILERAKRRIDVGNPPGKKGSICDAINWELLLKYAESEKDLVFITQDTDYLSVINRELFNPFLVKEWEKAKRSKIKYYDYLDSFFKENYPDIKLASELEKDILIQKLMFSENFHTTHIIINKLSQYEPSEFSYTELNKIADAITNNTQVSWIITDSDVKTFTEDYVLTQEEHIDEKNIKLIRSMLSPSLDENDD